MTLYFTRKPNLLCKRARPLERHGFVLVMALVMIAVAGIALAGFARKSLQFVQSVAAEQDKLQHRWGMISCENVLLQQSEFLLFKKDLRLSVREPIWPLSSQIEGQFRLGGLEYKVLLADEDAKINLNMLHHRSAQLPRIVQTQFQETANTAGLTLRMLPLRVLDLEAKLPVYHSWGQIFTPPANTDSNTSSIIKATYQTTCWGNRKLNLKRASDEAIRVVCKRIISNKTIDALLERRQELKSGEPRIVLAGIDMRASEKTKLHRLLSNRTNCYSLWVTTQNKSSRHTTLFVDRPGRGFKSNRLTFTW